MASSRETDGRTLLLLLGMYAVLISNVALYWTAPLPLPVHVLLGAIGIHMAFTIWHEAAHRNVSGRAWVNDLVGIVGMLPYMTPYFLQKWIHLQHHARLNLPEDPNRLYIDGSYWSLPLRYPRVLRYAKDALRDDPRSRGERLSDAVSLSVVAGIYAVALWQGVLLDVILLWLLPVVIAKLVMDWYINYLPHVGLPADRFLGTRIVDVPWLTPLILGHNYHAIHHLWPKTLWHRYRAVFKDRLDYLREHGVPIEGSVLGPRALPAVPRKDPVSG